MRIRDAQPGDATGLAHLLAELCYPDAEGRVLARAHALGERAARARGSLPLPRGDVRRAAGREAAHAFYESLGLEQVSRRYLKAL